MKIRSRLMLFTAVMALSTGMAAAAITRSDVVTTYQNKGYTYIEVKEGPTQIKVEAIMGSAYVEVVYDKASGDVVSSESGTASAEDAAQKGVSISTVDRDFQVGDDDEDDDGVDDQDEDDDADTDEDEDDEDADGHDDDDHDHDGDEDDADEDDDEEEDEGDDDDDHSGGSSSSGDDEGCDD